MPPIVFPTAVGKIKRNFHSELKTLAEASRRKYERYNARFEKWFGALKKKGEATEEDVRKFITDEFVSKGKATGPVINALKFRFNHCERREFDLAKLHHKGKTNEHKAYTDI